MIGGEHSMVFMVSAIRKVIQEKVKGVREHHIALRLVFLQNIALFII